MKKAIVTGANGFLGSWLIKELSNNGIEVYAVVRNEKSDIENIRYINNCNIVLCTLDNFKKLPEIIKDRDIDCFFHLAWEGSTGNDRGNYEMQLRNVKYTMDAVGVASKIQCKRFVGAGSLAELDCNAYISEDGAQPNIVSCYGSAKIAAHYMSKAKCNELGIEHIWAYIPNTFGIGNRTQNFINFATRVMLTGKRASFTDGIQPYDFVYVSDTVRGLYLMAERGKPFNSYYIGSNNVRQLKEYIKEIRDVINPDIKLFLGEVPFQGKYQPAEIFDCSKLIKDTGYECYITFNEGIKTTVDWLSSIIEEEKL